MSNNLPFDTLYSKQTYLCARKYYKYRYFENLFVANFYCPESVV